MMGFEMALFAIKSGKKVARTGWNGKSMWIAMHTPTKREKMDIPFIYMYTAQGDLVPWLASQTDILAGDWVEVFYSDKKEK